MNQKRLHKVFIWGFLFLYLLVAAISFFHAIQFFNVGNPTWMSVVLALSFEVGLALSLAAVLLSDKNKKSILPWILMITLTTVQVIGNVYSTFKYIALSEEEYYVYLEKPLLFWIEGISQETVQVIISWIIGAILPIIALFMTDMVASNIKNISEDNTVNNVDDPVHDPIHDTDSDPIHDTNSDTNSDIVSNVNEPVDDAINQENDALNDTINQENPKTHFDNSVSGPVNGIKKKILRVFQ